MHISPAFLALSLALTSSVVAHPMPHWAERPEAHTLQPAERYIQDGFHRLVRRMPKPIDEETPEEREKRLTKQRERNRQIALNRTEADKALRTEQQRARRNQRDAQETPEQKQARLAKEAEAMKKLRAKKTAQAAESSAQGANRSRQNPAQRTTDRFPPQMQAQYGAYGMQNSDSPSHTSMAPLYTPPHPPAPPHHAAGTIPVPHNPYDLHAGGTSHSGGSRTASQTPGNDFFAGFAAIDNALFGHMQGNNPHTGGRPQASQYDADTYSGTHNSGGPSHTSMALPYNHPQHPPAPPHHASTIMQVPPISHNPSAPVSQIPAHISPYYDTRYVPSGPAGMPNDLYFGGAGHGGVPVAAQVPISRPQHQQRPGIPPSIPDPNQISSVSSLAAAMPKGPRQ